MIKKKEKGSFKIPKWYKKVVKQLCSAVNDLKKRSLEEGTVLGRIQESDNFIIRGKSGIYVISLISSDSTDSESFVGKNIGPQKTWSDEILEEFKGNVDKIIIDFIFEVIKENISLVPRLWLWDAIHKILNNSCSELDNIYKPFNKWILLPLDKKKDVDLIDLLYKATSYEGLVGLYRYNNITQK